LPALEEMTDLAALAAFLHGNPWGTTPDELRATGAEIAAYHGEDDPTLDWGRLQAEQAGATFFTVPDGIPDSMANEAPVLAAALPLLPRDSF
jgi:hypothetical protein